MPNSPKPVAATTADAERVGAGTRWRTDVWERVSGNAVASERTRMWGLQWTGHGTVNHLKRALIKRMIAKHNTSRHLRPNHNNIPHSVQQ